MGEVIELRPQTTEPDAIAVVMHTLHRQGFGGSFCEAVEIVAALISAGFMQPANRADIT